MHPFIKVNDVRNIWLKIFSGKYKKNSATKMSLISYSVTDKN